MKNFCDNGTIGDSPFWSYFIAFVVTDDNGSTEKVINQITGELAEGTISQVGETQWSNGTATIRLETSETGVDIVYQVGNIDGTWLPYPEEGISGLNHEDMVYAAISDGTNVSKENSFEIQDGIGPTVTVSQGTITTNSIAVSASAVDSQWGMPTSPTYNYYIKESKAGSYPTEADYTGTNTNYTFTGLTQGTSYDIRVTTTDKAGNEGSKETKGITTETVGGATGDLTEGNIIASSPIWNNNTASITLSKGTDVATNLSIQWQINGIDADGWTTGESVTGLNHDDTVYARLTDGTNHGQEASVAIKDGTVPQQATITLSSTNVTTGTTVTATVTHTDNESGPNITACKYIWNTSNTNLGTNSSLYTGGTFSSNGQQISRSMSSKGTYYLHVLTVDKGGNVLETVSSAITVRQLATGITVSPTSVTLEEGQTRQLTATVSPTTANNRSVTWSSSNSTVASVSSSGLVTAKTEGSATITVKTADGSNKTATCKITVVNPKMYHWSGYSVIDINTYQEETTKGGTLSVGGSISGGNSWSSYTFNPSTGKFTGAGEYYGTSITTSISDSYNVTEDRVTRYQLESSRTFRMYYTTATIVSTQKGKGDYIGSVTSSSSSAYPTNGQSGSYWYVYDGYY